MTAERFETIHSTEADIPKDPARCAIRNYIARQIPWARHITVGMETIRLYDYRCVHNPEGAVGKCTDCVARCLVWATPLRVRQAIKKFDASGHADFPPFTLRFEEAQAVPATQDRKQKRRAMNAYRAAIAAGEHKPNKRTAKAKARAMSSRRHG
jgi:hypothetical protein